MRGIHENKRHGRIEFPFTVYRTRLPEYLRGYPLHWHEEMELICITEGSGVITVQAERRVVHAGDILVIPPQLLHGIEQLEDRQMECFNILFRLTMLEGESMERHIRQLHDRTRQVPVCLRGGTELNGLLRGHVGALIENRRRTEPEYELMVRSHLYAIAYQLLRHSEAADGNRLQRHTNYDKLKPALRYLEEHYDQPVSVRMAAAMCGFSDSHFMKLFRELTGTGFAQYVKSLRLEAAQKLLRSGSRVGEAAEAVGFHNLAYFTRAFQAYCGITPSQYRQQQKGLS